jgi:hypothetical protein
MTGGTAESAIDSASPIERLTPIDTASFKVTISLNGPEPALAIASDTVSESETGTLIEPPAKGASATVRVSDIFLAGEAGVFVASVTARTLAASLDAANVLVTESIAATESDTVAEYLLLVDTTSVTASASVTAEADALERLSETASASEIDRLADIDTASAMDRVSAADLLPEVDTASETATKSVTLRLTEVFMTSRTGIESEMVPSTDVFVFTVSVAESASETERDTLGVITSVTLMFVSAVRTPS